MLTLISGDRFKQLNILIRLEEQYFRLMCNRGCKPRGACYAAVATRVAVKVNRFFWLTNTYQITSFAFSIAFLPPTFRDIFSY